ncbi:MmcQ/YjbR family DNA-binding protein [Ekhidna sp.]|uniref:MmcQ/YjbR family DNA-binding protein n=1 Tax=Ekhidna sp. TaxID=2608089 RepID=UPI003B50DBAA
MINPDQLKRLALSFPETTEEPHFEKTSFKVRKKIFATYDFKNQTVVVKLSEVDQNVFSSVPGNGIYPVPNKWGKNGWTKIELDKVSEGLFEDALTTSYCEVAPNILSKTVRPDK